MFASLTSLTELDLGNNRISDIEAQSFSGLANLRELNLLENKLPKLEDIMMRYPSTLNAMYLDHNKLVSFHRETFSGQVGTHKIYTYYI
jgi:Leucine-rich repeat (LRR) protein